MNGWLGVLQTSWDWLLLSTLQACVIIAVIRIVQLGLRDRLAPRWHYALWLVLLIRMVLPWAPESSFSMFNLFAFEPPAAPVIPVEVVPSSAPVWVDLAPMEAAPLAVAPTIWEQIAGMGVLPLVWVAGMAGLLLMVAVKSLAVWRRIRRAPALRDERALAVLDACRETMDIRKPIRTAVVEGLPSPALFGLFRPWLLLPAGLVEHLTDDRLRFIFLHELGHYRRRDILVNWLMTVLLTLHWFNPLVWYAFYRMRADRELACDALALSHTGPEESRDYGLTILELLERQTILRQFQGAVGIVENRTHLKRRLAAIALFQKNSYRWTLLAAVLLATMGGVFLTDPAQGQAGTAEEAEAGEAVSEAVEPEGVEQGSVGAGDSTEEGQQATEPVTASGNRGAGGFGGGSGGAGGGGSGFGMENGVLTGGGVGPDGPWRARIETITPAEDGKPLSEVVSMDLENVPVWILLHMLKMGFQYEIVLEDGEEPAGTITLKEENVPLAAGLDMAFKDFAGDAQVSIGGAVPAQADDETRRPERSETDRVLTLIKPRHADAGELMQVLRLVISPRDAAFTVYEHTGELLVYAPKSVADQVRDVLEQLDVPRDEQVEMRDPGIEVTLDGAEVSLVFEGVHLQEIADFIAETYGVNVVIDSRYVTQPGAQEQRLNTHVTDGMVPYINLRNITLRQALGALLRPLNLTFTVEPGYIWITADPRAISTPHAPAFSPMPPPPPAPAPPSPAAPPAPPSPPAPPPPADEGSEDVDTASRRKIEDVLETEVSVVFEDTHLKEIVKSISEAYAINILLDNRVIAPKGTALEESEDEEYVTDGMVPYINLKNVKMADVLGAVLRPLSLGYSVQESFVWVTSPEKLRSESFD